MILGERIKLAMQKKGWKQVDLARELGHSAAWVSEILRKEDLRGDLIKRIAAALDIDVDGLMAADDSTFREALAGAGPSAARAGITKRLVVDSVVDETGHVLGHVAQKYAAHDEETRRLARVVELGHSRRGVAIPDARTVELAGVPPGCDLIDVRGRVVTRHGEQVVDFLGPGWILVVEPGAEPRSTDEDLVLAAHDAGLDVRLEALKRLDIGRPEELAQRLGPDGDEAHRGVEIRIGAGPEKKVR